jgi:autotransporter-associated beta strand protein
VGILLLPLSTSSTLAGSAAWKRNPLSGDWNNASNWTPSMVPNGPSDIATFALSNTTGVFLSANTEVNGMVFNPGASAFAITAGPTLTLTISGTGITNNSGTAQGLVTTADPQGNNRGTIQFRNGATLGDLTSIADLGPESSDDDGGITQFFDNSSAGNGTIINTTGSGGGFGGGGTEFYDSSTAANADFLNAAGFTFVSFFGNSTADNGSFSNGGTVSFSETSTAGNGTFFNQSGTVNGSPPAGRVSFSDTSTAGTGTFTNGGAGTTENTPGFTSFSGSSSAGNATFTCTAGGEAFSPGGSVSFNNTSSAENGTFIIEGGTDFGTGGTLQFVSDSTGGQARVEVFDNGSLLISSHNTPGVSIGSIEGTGLVVLGARNLTVGSNNQNTIFSGSIQGVGGSLTKVGAARLILSGANTYSGGTVINGGKLAINNETDSGTGSGFVHADAGTLGGAGIIAGAVTIGTGSGPGAFLAPAAEARKQATLTVESALTFNADATYTYTFRAKRNSATSDKVIANGVTINSGAVIALSGQARGRLTTGLTLTLISNTSANPISGTFSNLPDGAIVTIKGNNFQASYEGGDGNDLTLTVVP